MKLNFSNLNFSPDTSTSPSFGSGRIISVQDLREWWKDLPTQQKETISSLDFPDMIKDIANAANNAHIVCKLHPSGKTKDLVSWKKYKSEGENLSSHTFALNLLGKEILDNDLAELFSCYYILIVRDPKPSKHQPSENGQAQAHQLRSHIGIKKEKLDQLIDLLEKSITGFVEDFQYIPEKIDLQESYMLLTNQSNQSGLPNVNVPSYLKKLLEKFASFTFILEQTIFHAFEKSRTATVLEAKNDDQKIEKMENSGDKQFSEIYSLLKGVEEAQKEANHNASPLIVKTVSQVEKEKNIESALKEHSNTANNSTLDISGYLDISPNLQLEEHEHSGTQDSSREEKTSPEEAQKGEKSIKELKFSIPADSLKDNIEIETEEKESDFDVVEIYQGFIIGNLEIEFDRTDLLLIEDPLRPYQDSTETNIAQRRNKIFGEYAEQLNSEGYFYGAYDESYMNYPNSFDPYFMANYPQQPLYDLSGYYMDYPHHTYMPYGGYGLPSQHMESVTVDPNYYHQDTTGYKGNYNKDKGSRKTSFDNHSSFLSEKESLSVKNAEPFYPSTYERKNMQGTQPSGQSYYGKSNFAYEARPKLPPRFQKRKGSNYRS